MPQGAAMSQPIGLDALRNFAASHAGYGSGRLPLEIGQGRVVW